VARTLFLAALLCTAASAQEVVQEPAPAQNPPPAPPAGQQRLTLEDAVKLALQRNTDLQRQVLLALSSEQDKVLARSAILPVLSFNASRSQVRQGEGSPQLVPLTDIVAIPPSVITNGYRVGAQITQLIFDGGRWWNNLAAADLGLAASQAQVDEQRLQITYLVEQRFYEMIRAQRQLQVLSDAAARSRDQASFTQRLFEGGRATQADVYAARANRDNDEIQRLGQERNVELARADLALAIGLDPAEPLTVAEPPRLMDDPAQPPAAQEAVQRALANRPSLKAFDLTAQANRKSASAASGGYWPTVDLVGAYDHSAQRLDPFTESLSRNAQLSGAIRLTWNVFNGFSTDATARKAEIQTLLAENDLASGRRSVASDVEKAVAQLSTARAQARVAQQSEQTAKEGLRLARTRQEVGVGTQLEVRDAELKLTQAQLSVVGSLVDGREAEAALRRAQGG
jgi:outer membrane protein TolC